MKKAILILTLVLLLISICSIPPSETKAEPAGTIPSTTPSTQAPTTMPAETPPAETAPTLPPIVLELTEEEQTMLLKIGMAELGTGECTECIALVMCTVLNRVNADGFGSSIYGVLHAPEQFTPVSDGSYFNAEPNERCLEALDMVMRGWDESQGALYYEFCQGQSWHSKNLELLFQHCDTRFYK